MEVAVLVEKKKLDGIYAEVLRVPDNLYVEVQKYFTGGGRRAAVEELDIKLKAAPFVGDPISWSPEVEEEYKEIKKIKNQIENLKTKVNFDPFYLKQYLRILKLPYYTKAQPETNLVGTATGNWVFTESFISSYMEKSDKRALCLFYNWSYVSSFFASMELGSFTVVAKYTLYALSQEKIGTSTNIYCY